MRDPTETESVPSGSDAIENLVPLNSETFEKEEEEKKSPTGGEQEAAPDDSDSAEAPATPVRERTSTQESVLDESSPPMDDVEGEKSLPGSGAVTPVNVSEMDQEAEETGADATEAPCPSWSDALKSPTDGDQFSPSKELHRPGSLHGVGLAVAVDRAKKLSKCGRRCATLFFDIAAQYDTFAQSILKSSQALQSPMGGTPVAALSNACIKSLISFAKQMQGLAICVRGSVARPLHGSMSSLAETAPDVYNRYSKTRSKCFGARKAALQMRSKYVKAVREAEGAIRDLQQARQAAEADERQKEPTSSAADTLPSSDEAGSSISSTTAASLPEKNPLGALHPKEWEKSLKKLGQKQSVPGTSDVVIRLLNEVQTLEAQYCSLVAEENKAVSQSQTMEGMALEAVQELEEERLHFFVETIKRTVEAEKGALDKMILSCTENQDNSVDSVSKDEKKGNVFDSFVKRASSQFNEGIGFMESETLGLPEEVGELRDKVKSHLAERNSRTQSTKALVYFLDEVASACSNLAAGITTRLGQEGYGAKRRTSAPNGLLAVALEKNEGPNVLIIWGSLIAEVDDSVVAARCLAEALNACQRRTLNSLVGAENELKAASDADDQKWKHLCDAARTETRAQSRYRQTSDQFEKARHRARSVDDGRAAGEQMASPTTPVRKHSGMGFPPRKNSGMTQGMTKAIGNMISILPNGGEHAMKMMTPNARMKIAQTNLEGANEKEAKDKQALDAAVSLRENSAKSYTDSANSIIAKLKTTDDSGWDVVRSTLESSVSAFEDFRQRRYDSLKAPSQVVEEHGSAFVTKDMAEWTQRAKKHVAKKAKQSRMGPEGRSGSFINIMNASDPGEGLELGFSLKVELVRSESVHKLLALVRTDGENTMMVDVSDERKGEASPTAADGSEEAVKKPLRRSQTEPLSPTTKKLLSLSEALRERVDTESEGIALKPRLAPTMEASKMSATDKAETDVFVSHFWSDREEGETPPTVIESFSCAYWPREGEGYISPLLHGRMFTTSSTMYFVGWGGKKIVLEWKHVTSVERATTLGGTIENALRIKFSDASGESSYFFGSFAFRENAFELVERLSTIAKSLNEMTPVGEEAKALSPVPPDNVLKKMETVLSRKTKNVSIQKFYEVVWSEGNQTDCKPFYGPWLEHMGSRDVKVTDWEFSSDGSDSFVNRWDGERYSQRRTVDFEFTRKTHLYVGPPVAQVKQTQYCRLDGNDKVVLAMTVEMVGIPYADCFAVEVRWVARREGSQDLHVEVGVCVDFKKSTMFASKIRSGTVAETKPVHTKLFEAAKKACAAISGEEAGAEGPEEAASEVGETVEKSRFEFSVGGVMGKARSVLENPTNIDTTTALVVAVCFLLLFRFLSSLMFGGSGESRVAMENIELLGKRIDELHIEMRHMHRTLEEILTLMKEASSDEPH